MGSRRHRRDTLAYPRDPQRSNVRIRPHAPSVEMIPSGMSLNGDGPDEPRYLTGARTPTGSGAADAPHHHHICRRPSDADAPAKCVSRYPRLRHTPALKASTAVVLKRCPAAAGRWPDDSRTGTPASPRTPSGTLLTIGHSTPRASTYGDRTDSRASVPGSN